MMAKKKKKKRKERGLQRATQQQVRRNIKTAKNGGMTTRAESIDY